MSLRLNYTKYIQQPPPTTTADYQALIQHSQVSQIIVIIQSGDWWVGGWWAAIIICFSSLRPADTDPCPLGRITKIEENWTLPFSGLIGTELLDCEFSMRSSARDEARSDQDRSLSALSPAPLRLNYRAQRVVSSARQFWLSLKMIRPLTRSLPGPRQVSQYVKSWSFSLPR